MTGTTEGTAALSVIRVDDINRTTVSSHNFGLHLQTVEQAVNRKFHATGVRERGRDSLRLGRDSAPVHIIDGATNNVGVDAKPVAGRERECVTGTRLVHPTDELLAWDAGVVFNLGKRLTRGVRENSATRGGVT